MRAQLTLTLLLAPLTAMTACVTQRSAQKPQGIAASQSISGRAKNKDLVKEGQKTLKGGSPVLVTPIPQNLAAVPPPTKDLTKIFNRLNEPSMQLMDEDIQTALTLHPAAKGSMEEAVLVLAQLRLLKTHIEQGSKFQSSDLYEQNLPKEASSSAKPSMDQLFHDLNIDLLSSFNLNSNLKNLSTLALLKSLLDNTENNQTFTKGIQSLIDSEAQKWAQLKTPGEAHQAAIASLPPETPAVITPVAVPATETRTTESSEDRTTATDLKHSDAVLFMAQKLADKGEFRQAIDHAGRIDIRDPYFDQAKEKIKVYSNRAVQDLRQKAAQAFQNAMPAADNRAKSAYLKQAKDLLELALKDYPTADQLDTVRDNLAVITRDLSGLEQDSARDSTPKTQ